MEVTTTQLDPDENDPIRLWAEIHRLRAEAQGPDGHTTWKDAAFAERLKRIKAEEHFRKEKNELLSGFK